MIIYGLEAIAENVATTPSIDVYLKIANERVKYSQSFAPIADKLTLMAKKTFNEVFSYTPPKEKSQKIKPGMLYHYSPIKDIKNNEVFYDKLESIGKYGLLAMDMFDVDSQDTAYVSFNSVLQGENSVEGIHTREKIENKNVITLQGGSETSSLIFFVDNNPMIERLKKLGRCAEDDDFRYSELLDTDDHKLKGFFSLANCGCPDRLGTAGVCYLPMGMPASYISIILLPESVKGDEKLNSILSQYFTNATVIYEHNKKQTVSKNFQQSERTL